MEGLFLGLYNLAYPVGAAAFSPYVAYKLASAYKYRAGLKQKLSLELPPLVEGKKKVWFHAVSVGETQAVTPLIEEFKKAFPDVAVYFSTTTYTGMEVARKRLSDVADVLFYFPLDFYPVVLRVLNRVSPSAVAIVETEIWPTFSYMCAARGISLFMINGRISDTSFEGYLRVAPVMKMVLKNYERLFARSPLDGARLVSLGAPQDKVEVTGNIKFFSVYRRASQIDPEVWREQLGLPRRIPLWVCGSTHQGEEEAILDAYRALRAKGMNLKLCIAPRHPERFSEVAGLLESSGLLWGKRSEGGKLSEVDVLLLDTVGELLGVYSLAHVAFVGGSLVNVGGHNPLEPLAFGKPVVIGRYYGNFADIMEEMGRYILVVDTPEELAGAVEKILSGTYSFDQLELEEKFRGSEKGVLRILETLGEACDRA